MHKVDYSGYQYIKFEQEGRTMTVTFNRPATLNAMTAAMHEETSRIFTDLGMDHTIDVIILTGAGQGVQRWRRYRRDARMYEDTEMFDRSIMEAKKIVFGILDCEKVIICKMNGDAVGLGATIGLFCDIIFAADHARIGDPHVRVGLAAGDGGAVIWPQLIGYARAKEYLMTGDLVTAPDAARMGLINYCVPAGELDAKVAAFASKIGAGAMKSIKYTKTAINIGLKQLAHSMMDSCMAYEALTNRTLTIWKRLTRSARSAGQNSPAPETGVTIVNFGEPEHVTMLRDSIRRMLEKHAPREQMAKWDEEDRVPRSLMEHISALGVCGMTVPEEYGGSGRDILATMVTVDELSRRSMVIGTLYLMNACYGSMNILASGSDEQKARCCRASRRVSCYSPMACRNRMSGRTLQR